MPIFLEGQDDPRDIGAAPPMRAPIGAPEPDPFTGPPSLNEVAHAAFAQDNPIVSVIEAINGQSPDRAYDPNHNPLDLAKGTPLEQDPAPLLDSPNEATTRAIIAQRQREDSDRATLAQGGLAGTVAGVAAGLLDPTYYIPIAGELHGAQAAASFGRSALRAAATGAAQTTVSEGVLQGTQQTRTWAESAGNIATNTLLMGLLGGAIGTLSHGERAEAIDAMEAVRREATPINPADPASMSVQDHITPGESGFSQGVEQRADELHAAGVAASPIEAAEAAHIEGLPEEIAHEVDGGAAQEGIGAAAERGGSDGEPDPTGASGEPSAGLGSDGGFAVGADILPTDRRVSGGISADGGAGLGVAEAAARRGQVFFPGGSIDARYDVAEHADLVTSHDADFRVNPDYPSELQPRDRSGAPAQDQVNSIAADLQPDRLGPSPEANSGAPIVGPDGVVESGNGRVLAIGRAYELGRGEDYRAWLERQGFDTSGMDRPVLVGMRETPMDMAARADFAHAANGSASLRMSATEQALSDARHLDGPTLDLVQHADLSTASNRDFARSFIDKLPEGERGGLLTLQGGLSANGVQRARAALTARAYGDPAFLGRAFDHPDPNIKAIAGAMSDAAPTWARMRDAATNGDIAPGHDITGDVLQAVHTVMRARDEGRPTWEQFNQHDFFKSDTSQLAARMFFRDEAMRQPAGRKAVAEALTSYAEEAAKNTLGGRLFDDAVAPVEVLRRMGALAAEKIGGLFDQASQDVLAMTGRNEDVVARTRTETNQNGARPDATETATDEKLSLQNPRTGKTVEAQSTASLKDMLGRFQLGGDASADPLLRASSLAIGSRLEKLVGDTSVFTVGLAEMRTLAEGRLKFQSGYEPAGFFDPTSGHIVVLDDALRDPREGGQLLLHEGSHAFSRRVLVESPAARQLVDTIRQAAIEAHEAAGGGGADHYGLRDVDEFVAEGHSNPEFQRFLASIPASDAMVKAFDLDGPAHSLWDILVAAVRKILGLAPDEHTLLDATMRLGPILEDERAALPEVGVGDGAITPSVRQTGSRDAAGADVSDVRDLALKSFGIEKVPGLGRLNAQASPNLRVYSGDSVQAKRTMAGLADTGLKFTQHDRGIPTSPSGTVETAVRQDKAKFLSAAHDALQTAWVDHRYGGGAPGRVQRTQDAVADLRGKTPAGKLSFKDFKSAIYDAMYSGDIHPIPQVQQAARELRAKVFDPILKRAQETMGPDGRPMVGEALSPPKGDQSFIPRMWNKEAVISKRYQLAQRITDWLGSEQATKAEAQDRIRGFVDDMKASSDRLGAMAEDDPARSREQATHDGIRAKIEKEVANWQGSSSAEAKAALAQRAEDESLRQGKIDEGTYRGAGERLTSADDAVDGAVRRILADDRGLSRGELQDRANEIVDRIIGSPDGRIPYDAASGGPKVGFTGGPQQQLRGSLNERDFAIPTALVRDFVHSDMEHVVASYLRTMLPDIELTRRYGDVDLTHPLRRIQEEYSRKIGPDTTENEARAINAARDGDIRDVAAVRDRLRGVYGWNPDPSSRQLANIVRDFHMATSLSSLGTSVLNRFNDLGGQAVMRYGLANTFNDAWRPYFKGLVRMSPLSGIARKQAADMGVGVDGLLGHLRHNLSDINESYMPGNKFSRGLAWANDRSMVVNMHGPWTDYTKAMGWTVAQAELGRVADRVAQGTATRRDLATLADANLDPYMAARISRQLAQHSTTVDGVRLATTGEWTDAVARDAFERTMSQEVNRLVITGGAGTTPLFVSKPIGSLIGQFKSFTAAAHENILLANLQQRDGRTLQGMLVSMAMGMLGYRLYTLASGQQASERPQDWIKEGLARSALTGWFNEGNNLLAKFTAGKVDYNRLYGADRPLTRRTENSPLAELLGPAYARLEGLTGIGVHVLSGKGSAADIHQARMALPLQNLMGARILFDDGEDGLANAFGFKPRNHTPTQWPTGPTPYPQ